MHDAAEEMVEMQTTKQHEHLHVWRCLRTRATLFVADCACAREVRQTALPSRAHRNHNMPEPFDAEREPNARSSTYLTLSLSLAPENFRHAFGDFFT